MADYMRDQLIAGLRRAAAAGDIQAANEIAAALDAMPAEQQRLTPEQAMQAERERLQAEQIAEMSGGERFRAGVGGSLVDAWEGLKQMGARVQGALSPTNPFPQLQLAELQAAEAERREIDRPLNETTAGMAGRVTGTIAQIVGPGALLKLAGAPAAASAFLPTTIPGMAAQGAVLGALQPTVEGESVAQNAAVGGALGAALPLGLRAVGNIGGGAASLIEPFTAGGQERIVARTLVGAADDPARLLARQASPIPGVTRTLAEETLDPGISQLQRAAQTGVRQVASEMANLSQANNAARMSALIDAAGDDATMAAARQAREAATTPLYEQAMRARLKVTPELSGLLDRPVMRKAVTRAEELAANEGVQLFANEGKQMTARGAQLVKMALDDTVNSGPMSGIAGSELRAAAQARDKLVGLLEGAIPSYRQANATYRELSRPINQMEVLRESVTRAGGNIMDPVTGAYTMTADKIGRINKNLDAITQNVTGRANAKASDLFAKQQLGLLGDLAEDMARVSRSETMARAPGSPTAQYLAGQNLLNRTLGGLAPEGFLSSGPAQSAATMASKVYEFAGVESKIGEILAEALTNPARAQQMILRLPASQQAAARSALEAAGLGRLTPAVTGSLLSYSAANK